MATAGSCSSPAPRTLCKHGGGRGSEPSREPQDDDAGEPDMDEGDEDRERVERFEPALLPHVGGVVDRRHQHLAGEDRAHRDERQEQARKPVAGQRKSRGQRRGAEHEEIEMRKGAADQRPGRLRRQRGEDEGGESEGVEHRAAEQERGREEGQFRHQCDLGLAATPMYMTLRTGTGPKTKSPRRSIPRGPSPFVGPATSPAFSSARWSSRGLTKRSGSCVPFGRRPSTSSASVTTPKRDKGFLLIVS